MTFPCGPKPTHCKRGHPFGDYRRPCTGSRFCLECARVRRRSYYAAAVRKMLAELAR